MLSQAEVKFLKSLKLKKFRQKYQKILIEGDKLVRETLIRGYPAIESIYASEAWIKTQEELLKLAAVPVIHAKQIDLERITAFKSPSEVAAVVSIPSLISAKVEKKSFYLFLDNIRDPGNLGTILRIADWFGVPGVFCSPGCAEQWNPKVVRASMGSVFEVNVQYQALDELCQQYDFDQIIGTGLEGISLNAYKRTFVKALVIIGNESSGISSEILRKCDIVITVPGRENARAESLNAAILTGILCSHWQ